MRPDYPDEYPLGSFRRPVIPPVSLPDDGPFVTVSLPSPWLPYIYGCLFQLLLRSTWNLSDENQWQTVQGEVFNLIHLFNVSIPEQVSGTGVNIGMESLIQVIEQDGQCVLQYRCCVGDAWNTLATASQAGQSGQPGGGQAQPKPGGGQACYHAVLNTNSQWFLPTNVNTGDVIEVQNGTGATSSSHNSEWRCIDGEQFFAGACVGYPATFPTDPVPTSNTGTLIANVGGTYYSLLAPLMVPSGVTNSPVIIQVNDATLTGLSGQFAFDVCVTNNQSSTWEHKFLGGFFNQTLLVPGATGYTDGAYSVSTDSVDTTEDANTFWYLTASLNFPSTTITRIRCKQTVSIGRTDGARSGISFDGTLTDTRFLTANEGAGVYMVDTGHISEAHTSIWFIVSDGRGDGGNLTDIIIDGLGTDPF